MKNRCSFVVFTIALLVATFFFSPTWAQPLKARICVPKGRSEFMKILVEIARERGHFKKNNVELIEDMVTYGRSGNREYKVNSSAVKQLDQIDLGLGKLVAEDSGRCDFGASNIERFIAGSEYNEKVRPLYLSTFGEEYDTHLFVPKNSKITKISELRGKRIRIGQLPTYIATLGVLEAHGMKIGDVKVEVDFSGNEKFEALESGYLAASTAYLPSMAYHLAMDVVRILEPNIIQKYVGPRLPHSLLIVNAEFARKNPATVEAVTRSLGEAHAYLLRNRQEIFHSYARDHKKKNNRYAKNEKNADLEKAAAFVGNVPLIDMTKDSAERNRGYCDIRFYAGQLKRRGLFPKTNDLSAWMGVDSKAAESCSALARAD